MRACAGYLAGPIGGYCDLLAQDDALALAELRAGLGTEEGGLNRTLSKALSGSGAHEALENGLDGLRAGLGLPPKS